jgi:hypothetical protein
MTRVLIVGGYGLVGGWIARHLAGAGHDIELVLAGRRPAAGKELASETGASVARLDAGNAAASLAEAGPADLVISAVQDPDDDLLRASLRTGAAHIGIVRKTHNVGATAMTAALLARRPALVMGHWQAGVATFAALAAVQEFEHVDRIEMAGLYDYADPAGPMSRSDSGTFFGQALVRRDGHWEEIAPTDNTRMIERAGMPAFAAQPMGVLDVAGLVAATGAPWVRFDLGAGDSIGTAGGGPASHEIYVDIWGQDGQGESRGQRVTVSDRQGQAHLTALGVLIGAERILGLDGQPAPQAGLHFPEAVIDPRKAISRLREFGVHIETAPLPASQPVS